jgi:hypothetical protein
MDSQAALYRYHAANLSEVERGLQEVTSIAMVALAKDDAVSVRALTRICTFLLSAKIEARFYKSLYEPPVPREFRDLVNAPPPRTPSLEEKLKRAVNLAFQLYYAVPAPFEASNAPAAARAQHQLHTEGITRLVPIITLRNKVAHGQWRFALTNDGTSLNQATTTALHDENLLTLRLKANLVDAIAGGINDLLVSQRAHDRDLSKHQDRVRSLQRELDTRSFSRFAAAARKREERSHQHRRDRASAQGGDTG